MSNLIKADLFRLFKTKSYKIGLLISIAISFISIAAIAGICKAIPLFTDPETMAFFLAFPYASWAEGVSIFTVMATSTNFLSLMVTCMLASIFVNEEQTSGFVKNIAGQTKDKGMLIFSKFIVLAFVALSVILCYMLGSLISGLLFFGGALNFTNAAAFFTVIGVKFLIFLSVNAIILFLCTLTKSKSLAVAVGVVFGSGATMIIYFFASLLITAIVKVDITLSKFTPDGLIFGLGMNSEPAALTKALVVALVYAVVFTGLSVLVMKKRDTK